jgi:ankyrin repeat protein
MNFLQVQNPGGLFSNDFIFHVSDKKVDPQQLRGKIEVAIYTGNLSELKRLVESGADVNALTKDADLPLSSAAFHGRLEHVRFLLQKGAVATGRNRDGGTPLHVAALMGRFEIAKLLLSKGAKASVRNKKGESSIDTVSGEWNDGMVGLYRFLNGLTSNKVDLQEIRKARPRMLKLLKDGP